MKLAKGSKQRENFPMQKMKADQKYSKVVGIKGGGGGGGVISMRLKEHLRESYINEINEFQVQLSPRSKKSSIVGVYILIAIDFF